ncbi:hypothetical protein CM15mP37_01560 [bacterium]|nr:MAG: hypothetical protein CM15mP37_01560 [bacterium]
MIIFLTNCSGNSEIVNQDNIAEEESAEVLKALRTKDGFFANNSRNMKSSVANRNDFDQKFPGTNVSCGYVLRYFFYTNIYLNSNDAMLISMDGTRFDIPLNNKNQDFDSAIYETKIVINLIRGMYYGNSEFKEFIEKYPNAEVD